MHKQNTEVSVKCLPAYASDIRAVYNAKDKYEDMYHTCTVCMYHLSICVFTRKEISRFSPPQISMPAS